MPKSSRFRDEAFTRYFTDENYSRWFGADSGKVRQPHPAMTGIRLKRKLLRKPTQAAPGTAVV